MVVQRCGDAVAAAIFEVLHAWIGLGTAAVTVAGGLLCIVWLGVALLLGRQYRELCRQQQQVQVVESSSGRSGKGGEV